MHPFLSQALLIWYDHHARTLPWRAGVGATPNPYHVLLSEIMLQQTQVATVIPYFKTFTTRWPTLHDLAAASMDDVLHAWQGLGYYRRARNLKACVEALVHGYGGQFPKEEALLLSLPGLGPYTAAAIAAIAFEQPAVAIDGNIMRVFSRYDQLDAVGPQALRKAVLPLATDALPPTRRGDYTQALMDLGATVCKPKQPRCEHCPLQAGCLAFRANTVEAFPKKALKAPLSHRYGRVFWVEDAQGQVFIHPQQDQALLKGLMTFPSTPWGENGPSPDIPGILTPFFKDTTGDTLPTPVRHTFTHFKLELQVWKGTLHHNTPLPGLWVHPDAFGAHAFSTLMKKVARVCLAA